MDALSQQMLSQWEEERAEITSIQTYNFTPTAILLVTVDDMGGFIVHCFYFLQMTLFDTFILHEWYEWVCYLHFLGITFISFILMDGMDDFMWLSLICQYFA